MVSTRQPTHPGEILRDIVLPAMKLRPDQFADLISYDHSQFDKILAGKRRITNLLAISIGEVCGNGPRLWLSLQATFDDWNKKYG